MTVALEGHYSAYAGMLALPAADVQKMLMRNDCRLAPQSVTPPGQHPVILMLGNETQVDFPVLPFLKTQYLEVTLAVPWVICPRKPEPVMAHVSRLWLNKLLPTIGGRVLGFPKFWTRNQMTATSYGVQSLIFGRAILTARYNAYGTPGKPADFPHFRPLWPVFQQKFLQKLFCIAPTISLEMQWEMVTNATIQPIDWTVEVYRDTDPGIPAGTYTVPGIDKQPMGAFLIDVDWKLSWPNRV